MTIRAILGGRRWRSGDCHVCEIDYHHTEDGSTIGCAMAEIKDWDCALALSIHLRMFGCVICPECLKAGPEGIRATFRKRAEEAEAKAELIRNAKDESEIPRHCNGDEIENPVQFFEESAAMLRLNENEEWIIPSHDEWKEHTLKLERDEIANRTEAQRKWHAMTELEQRRFLEAEAPF